jgi:hypothetical protein
VPILPAAALKRRVLRLGKAIHSDMAKSKHSAEFSIALPSPKPPQTYNRPATTAPAAEDLAVNIEG